MSSVLGELGAQKSRIMYELRIAACFELIFLTSGLSYQTEMKSVLHSLRSASLHSPSGHLSKAL